MECSGRSQDGDRSGHDAMNIPQDLHLHQHTGHNEHTAATSCSVAMDTEHQETAGCLQQN